MSDSMIYHGVKFVVGEMPCPSLPPGFVELPRSYGVARAKSIASGDEYLIAAEPPRLVKVLRLNPPHTIQCDFNNSIPL